MLLDIVFRDIDDHVQPPAVIKPQSALNERETMETEVISECSPHPAGVGYVTGFVSETLTRGFSV